MHTHTHVNRTSLWIATRAEGAAEIVLWELEGDFAAHPAFEPRARLSCAAPPAACFLLDGLFFVALHRVPSSSPALTLRCDCWLLRRSPSPSSPSSALLTRGTVCRPVHAARVVRFVAQDLLAAPSDSTVAALCQPRAFGLAACGSAFGVALLAPLCVQRGGGTAPPALALAPAAVFVAASDGTALREVPPTDTWDAADWRWALPRELLHGRVVALHSLWTPDSAIDDPSSTSSTSSNNNISSQDEGSLRFAPPTATLALLADGAGVLLRGAVPLAAARPGTFGARGAFGTGAQTPRVALLDADGALLVCVGSTAWIVGAGAGQCRVQILCALPQPVAALAVTPSACTALGARTGEVFKLFQRPLTPEPSPVQQQQRQQQQRQQQQGQQQGQEAALCAPFERCLAQTEAEAADLGAEVAHLCGLLRAVAPQPPPPQPPHSASAQPPDTVFVAVEGARRGRGREEAHVVLAPGIVAHCTDAAAGLWLVASAVPLSPEARTGLAQRLGTALGARRAAEATTVPSVETVAAASRLLAAAEGRLRTALAPQQPSAASGNYLAVALLDLSNAMSLFDDLSDSS